MGTLKLAVPAQDAARRATTVPEAYDVYEPESEKISGDNTKSRKAASGAIGNRKVAGTGQVSSRPVWRSSGPARSCCRPLPRLRDVSPLAQRFQTSVNAAFTWGKATPDLLPMVFAQACVDVLGVDGAGLSLIDHLRIPLAASDENVATAERLQTTIGEGPCLAAVAQGRPLLADLTSMAASWPTFHERFVAETPYLSVASVPLRSADGALLGALDLYSTSPHTLTHLQLAEVDAAIAVPIASMLFHGPTAKDHDGGPLLPSWMSKEQVEERMNVWVAVGMSIERLEMNNRDALALLRGYAYSHDLTLDQAARLLTEHRLRPDQLLA